MVARGRVQNGVVVLAEGVRLPEGQEVMVLPAGDVSATHGPTVGAVPRAGAGAHSILDIAPACLGAVPADCGR
jgi:hypothetical protein